MNKRLLSLMLSFVMIISLSYVNVTNTQAASSDMVEDEKKWIVENHEWTDIDTVDDYVKEFINDSYKLNNVFSEKVFFVKTDLNGDELWAQYRKRWDNYAPLNSVFSHDKKGGITDDIGFHFTYNNHNYYCILIKNNYKFSYDDYDTKLNSDNYFRWKVFRDNIIARTGMNDERLCPEEKIMIYNNYIGRRVISNSDDPKTYYANDIIFKYDLELASDEVNDTLKKNYAKARDKIITTIDKKMARVKNYTDIDTDPDLEAQRNWIKNYDNGTLLGIGQCSSMTGLFNDFMIACGVEVVNVEMCTSGLNGQGVADHVFTVFKNCQGTWTTQENQDSYLLRFGGYGYELDDETDWDDITNNDILDWYGITPHNTTDILYNEDSKYYNGSEYKVSFNNSKYYEQTPATCTTPGKSVVCCALTGEELTIDVPATHNYEMKEYNDATCKEDGHIIKKCVDCGHETTEVVPKRNCSPVVKVSTKYLNSKHTLYADDYKIVCRDCGKVMEEYTYDIPVETTTVAPTTTTTKVTTTEPTTVAPTTKETTISTSVATTTPEITTDDTTTVETTENVTTSEPESTTENEIESTVPSTEQTTSNNETTNETITTDNVTDNIDMTTTTKPVTSKYAKPSKVKIIKTYSKKKSSKKIRLSIKKVTGAKGYQIAVFKTKTNAKKNKHSLVKKVIKQRNVKKIKYTIKSKKFKNKKTLYVRIRAYKKYDKTNVYGKWSDVKKIKITK